MRDNSAMTLLEYLYDQLDALSTVDLTDETKVDSACRVNRAMNDTAKSIISIADMGMRAYEAHPTVGSMQSLKGFFDAGGSE